MTLFDVVFKGNDAVYGLTENAINDAIAKYGEDKAVSFPDTAYCLPCYYAVTGVKVTECSDTPGLGLKSQTPEFQGQYQGAIPESGAFEVTKTGEAGKIDAISGATITTNAVTNSVNYAIEAYNQVTGGAN